MTFILAAQTMDSSNPAAIDITFVLTFIILQDHMLICVCWLGRNLNAHAKQNS
jgi:hypothetical protein